MNSAPFGIGLDCGSAAIKIAVLSSDRTVVLTRTRVHHGAIEKTALVMLEALPAKYQDYPVVLTGSMGRSLATASPSLHIIEEIPALQQGITLLAPEARSVIAIGSQSARFITGLGGARPPRFAVNEHCAGGTGSFFEDQMSRLGLPPEKYSELVTQARSLPRLSGRCAVFAKTDIIHRQQEGGPVPDILLGLCYAMIRNYKAVIVRGLPVEKPLVLCGGIGHNSGVVQAVHEVFALAPEECILPAHVDRIEAIGAGLTALTTKTCTLQNLCEALRQHADDSRLPRCQPLALPENLPLRDPVGSGVIPPEGCVLGIDVGSTSTDLVLISQDGTLIDLQYLRTAGDPEGAVRQGLESIRSRFGTVPFLAVGVTGSGRTRIAQRIGADVVRDEITAQARAARWWVPDADTVFEIGGQDSKYIALQNGQVVDFQMNKICAAGTGSFVEEQATRMAIPLAEFVPLALSARAPVALGERCTVFIETAIQSALSRGATHADIAAGLCHAIVRNYLHKVVSGKPVGQRVVLQGGVAYNPGIVAAFHQELGDRLTVSPCFSASGAFGAALLALEEGIGPSQFHGFEPPAEEDAVSSAEASDLTPEIRKNIAFYEKAGQLLTAGYAPEKMAGKKTVGVPFALLIHKFFPMANAFFTTLGYNVLLSPPSNENIMRLAQETAQAETCYPIKLLHGHMAWLAEQGVDYIFLPCIHTMRHETSHVAHNYGCVYMQTAPQLVARSLDLEARGIKLLSPVFDLDFGKEAMASAMLDLGKILGKPKPLCVPALMAGAMAVRKHTAAVEKQGQALLAELQPEDKVLVLITRNYGLSDPVLNMGIPQQLLARGHKVITLSHLPAHDLALDEDHPNLYWPFGQHILAGAKLAAHHPNLYAVYLTNHGCGPDTMLSHLFRQEMGDKPYLQIEVDEHFSPVGVITRIEAFLQSLKSRPAQPLPADFDTMAVQMHGNPVRPRTEENAGPLYVPALQPYTPYIQDYLHHVWQVETRPLPMTSETLALGRSETNAKEYLPFPALLGAILTIAEQTDDPFQVLIPSTEGAEADGQYAWALAAVLARRGLSRVTIVAPLLETLPQTMPEPALLRRALLTGDLLLCAPQAQRQALAPAQIPDWPALMALAAEIGHLPTQPRHLGISGEPLTLFTLHDQILDTLEERGWQLHRAPLSEYLCFLWKDAGYQPDDAWLEECAALHQLMGAHSPFTADLSTLSAEADQWLPAFAGAGGRYRLAKALAQGRDTAGVLLLAPRYENTATVLEMTGALTTILHLSLALDADWDEGAWSRLNTFLYYISKTL